jgi:hypothetical protein
VSSGVENLALWLIAKRKKYRRTNGNVDLRLVGLRWMALVARKTPAVRWAPAVCGIVGELEVAVVSVAGVVEAVATMTVADVQSAAAAAAAAENPISLPVCPHTENGISGACWISAVFHPTWIASPSLRLWFAA